MGSHTTKGAALLVLAVALAVILTGGCESSDVLAPSGSQIIFEANPATLFIDENAGETQAQSVITSQWFDSTGAFPLEGLDLTFSTTGGTLAPALVTTNGNGVAQTVLTLGLDDPLTVTVTVRSGTISDTVIVERSEGQPIAVIQADPPNEQRIETPVTFDGRGSSDPDGDITCYQWSIAGLDTETVQSPTASRVSRPFADEQTLTVTLRVSDRDDSDDFCVPGTPADSSLFGGTASIEYEIYCDRTDPIVVIGGVDGPVSLGGGTATVALTSTVTDPESDDFSYEWLCFTGDPSPQTNATATCEYTEDDIGSVTVSLKATNDCDRSTTETIQITVTS